MTSASSSTKTRISSGFTTFNLKHQSMRVPGVPTTICSSMRLPLCAVYITKKGNLINGLYLPLQQNYASDIQRLLCLLWTATNRRQTAKLILTNVILAKVMYMHSFWMELGRIRSFPVFTATLKCKIKMVTVISAFGLYIRRMPESNKHSDCIAPAWGTPTTPQTKKHNRRTENNWGLNH